MPRAGSSARTPASIDPGPQWRELLRLIPGYDPFAQAEGCWFELEAAQLALDFFPECLKHIEGKLRGKPFRLERWQQAIIANLFGWMKRDEQGDVCRRYREAFIMVPRKNGKSPLAAGLALFVLFCDPEMGQQDYIAAGSREQAGKLFRQAKGMVDQEPELKDRCRCYGGKAEAGQSRSIVREEVSSFLRVIASDAAGEHGGNTSLVIIDETHVQHNRELIDVLTTSMASANRRHPLMVNITTAGHDRKSICWEKYQYACRVRNNDGDKAKPGYDPAFLPVIYEAAPDADWTSEAVWAQVNPNLGVSVSLEYLRRECQRAKEIPDYENTFRQLHLDLWTEQASRWLSMEKWHACGEQSVREEELEGRLCYGAIDLASTQDITALVLTFPDDDGGITLLPRFWVPRAMIERRVAAKEGFYQTWERLGLLRVTEGDWCDYTLVEKEVLEWNERFNIQRSAFDPREASMLAQRLINAGLKMEPFIQSFANYNEAVKLFEQLVGEGKVRHGGHKVLDWMAGNVALDRNVAGLRLPAKGKSGDKIDGIAAALMGLALLKRYTVSDEEWFTPGCLTDRPKA